MKRRRSLYARPEIVRGQQCAEAPLGRWRSDTKQLPWLRSRWQCCHCRADLGCQATNAGPTGGARRVRRAAFVVVVIEDVRRPSVPFVRSLSTLLPVRHGVSGGVDGVRKAVRSWRPSGTLDATAPTLDGTRLADAPALSTGAGSDVRAIPVLVAAGGGRRRACACRSVRSGPGREVCCAGWPSAWSDAGRWRCPPLGRRRPDRVQTRRLGGHRKLGMSGRPDGREVGHVRRRASHCRVSAGGLIGVRRCPGGCPAAAPGGRGWPADCGRVRPTMASSLRGPPGGPGLGARADGRLRRGSLLARHRSGRRASVWRGGSVGLGKRLPSVGASGPDGGSTGRRRAPRRG
jgi:hypothetical protein